MGECICYAKAFKGHPISTRFTLQLQSCKNEPNYSSEYNFKQLYDFNFFILKLKNGKTHVH